MATHSSILAGRIPRTEEPGSYSPWGRKKSDMTERLSLSLFPTPSERGFSLIHHHIPPLSPGTK